MIDPVRLAAAVAANDRGLVCYLVQQGFTSMTPEESGDLFRACAKILQISFERFAARMARFLEDDLHPLLGYEDRSCSIPPYN